MGTAATSGWPLRRVARVAKLRLSSQPIILSKSIKLDLLGMFAWCTGTGRALLQQSHARVLAVLCSRSSQISTQTAHTAGQPTHSTHPEVSGGFLILTSIRQESLH